MNRTTHSYLLGAHGQGQLLPARAFKHEQRSRGNELSSVLRNDFQSDRRLRTQTEGRWLCVRNSVLRGLMIDRKTKAREMNLCFGNDFHLRPRNDFSFTTTDLLHSTHKTTPNQNVELRKTRSELIRQLESSIFVHSQCRRIFTFICLDCELRFLIADEITQMETNDSVFVFSVC